MDSFIRVSSASVRGIITMYRKENNKPSENPSWKIKAIILLLLFFSSLFLIERYADRPVMDFQVKLIPLEISTRFNISCCIINGGMKTGKDISFQLKVPEGLRILNLNDSVFFPSFPPLTRKNLEWTIDAVKIGTFDIECTFSYGTETITKKLYIQAVYRMIIVLEKVKVIDDTDWLDPGDIYLAVKVNADEIRIPETGNMQMESGHTNFSNITIYNELVTTLPLVVINVWDEELLWSDSLGSINERVPFNLNST